MLRFLNSLAKMCPVITAVVLLRAISCLSPAWARARVEITPCGGYQWGGTVSSWEGEFRIPGTGNWSIALNVDMRPDTQLELCFTRQYSVLEVRWAAFSCRSSGRAEVSGAERAAAGSALAAEPRFFREM